MSTREAWFRLAGNPTSCCRSKQMEGHVQPGTLHGNQSRLNAKADLKKNEEKGCCKGSSIRLSLWSLWPCLSFKYWVRQSPWQIFETYTLSYGPIPTTADQRSDWFKPGSTFSKHRSNGTDFVSLNSLFNPFSVLAVFHDSYLTKRGFLSFKFWVFKFWVEELVCRRSQWIPQLAWSEQFKPSRVRQHHTPIGCLWAWASAAGVLYISYPNLSLAWV